MATVADTSPLVGRATEMAVLEQALSASLGGRGALVLIAGEPGIGKTSLAEALAAHASQRGARALWGRCWEGGAAPAYWPWRQILRSYAHGAPRAADELGSGAADLAPILSDSADEYFPPAATDGTAALAFGDARFRLFDAAATFLRRTAERQPLVLIFDDMHAADESSLLLLRFCARELSSAPLLMLCTHRETEVRLQPALTAQFAALASEGRRMVLAGWSVEEVGERLRRRADARLPADFAAALHRLTDGNPFFVEEIAGEVAAGRLAVEALRRDAVPLSVPEGVREALRRRLAAVPEPEVRRLRVAALIGREFDAGLLQRVAGGSGEDAVTLPELIDALDRAVAVGLLHVRRGEPGRYAFAHALVREALRHDVPPAQRMAQHRTIGEALEAHGGAAQPDGAAHLAYHFFQAAAAGGAEKAVAYSRLAGAAALRDAAYEDAVHCYQQGLDALRFLPPNEAQRCELLLALGRAQRLAGRIPAAREAYGRAAGLARSLGLRPLAARAALGFGRVGETGRVDIELVNLLERTVELLGAADDARRARLLARLALALYFSTEPTERARCEPLSSEALAIARRIADDEALGYALIARHFVLWGPDNAPARLALSAELVRLATQLDNVEIALEAHLWRALDLLESGDGDGFALERDRLHHTAETVRLPVYRWHSAVLASMWALACGRTEDAEDAAVAALALGVRYHVERAEQLHAAQIFFARREQRRLLELEPAVRAFAERFPALRVWSCGVALLLADLGRTAEARLALAAALRGDPLQWPADGNWLPSLAMLAEVCAAVGDRPRAARLRAVLTPHAGRQVVLFDGIALLGPVDYFLGLLARTDGDAPAARRHFQSALRQSERLAATALAARARDALTRLDGDDNRAAQAADLAAAPREIAAAHGVFRREGAYWTVAFGGVAARVKHRRGLSYLAHLLRHPGEEFHALEMTAIPGSDGGTGAPTAARRRPPAGDDGEDLLDARAQADYRQRLRDLHEQLEEAEALNDLGRTGALRAEMQALTGELSRALGLGGRNRAASSDAERARVAVTKAISLALKAIGERHPPLQRHLARVIKTGTFCGYRGDPDEARDWELE